MHAQCPLVLVAKRRDRIKHASPIEEHQFDPDPIEQFRRWYSAAAAPGVVEPDRMTLATASPDGRPSARMVLLRGFDARGFVFFTGYASRKGRELEANPRAALVFYWPHAHRQIRVEGAVERVSARESDVYFDSRAVGSRLSAIASPQSEIVSGRAELERRVKDLVVRYRRQRVPIRRPTHWGGYRVVPSVIEFWQRGRNRLHDRLRYVRSEGSPWRLERLAP
jgi:pyridoxamine 5'-phosphate oxidase